MSKQHQSSSQKAPAKLPGDPLSDSEDRETRESSLSQIKAELEAVRVATEARERAMAKQLEGSTHQIAQLSEDIVEHAKHHDASVDLIRRELEEQAAQNPPRSIPGGPDEASLELIKAEMAKARKRVVLPAG